MDVLSEALSTVRVNAAVFFNAEFTAPWGFLAPRSADAVARFAPGVEHIVFFHLLTEGRAVARSDGEPDLHLEAGDIIIVPQGDSYSVSNGNPARYRDGGAASLERFHAGDLGPERFGGGGERTTFVCGYFGCERRALRLFLSGLPRMMAVSIRGDEQGDWLETSIRHLVSEAAAGRPGGRVLLSKMAEVLFVDALRRHMASLPEGQVGWLAGARDGVVGAALAALHRTPDRHWTLPGIATEVGASRSVLAERFHHFLGESPIAYLTRWRMQLAARMLVADSKPLIQLAMDVGYESEAAFNRAFKREFGLPPAQYRRQMAEQAAAE